MVSDDTAARLARLEAAAERVSSLQVRASDLRTLFAMLRALQTESDDALVESSGLGQLADRALERARLTAKEREVARLLLKGLSTRELAGVTGNTEKRLKHHIASIFRKFGVRSRAELFHDIFPT